MPILYSRETVRELLDNRRRKLEAITRQLEDTRELLTSRTDRVMELQQVNKELRERLLKDERA